MKLRPISFLPAALLAGLSLCASLAQAADVFGPPSTVDYQGRVLDGNGAILAPDTPANYEMRFRIYDDESAGNVVWAEKQIVTVYKGQFSVRLGEGSAIANTVGGGNEGTVNHDTTGLPGAFNGKARFLGVTVVINGQSTSEVQPRLAFLSSPFSYVSARSQVADRVIQSASGETSSLNLGSVSYAPLTISGATTLGASGNSNVAADATAAAFTAILPAAADNKEVTITKTDASANPVTVAAPGGATIVGLASPILLNKQGDSVTLRNIGNDKWTVVGRRDLNAVSTDNSGNLSLTGKLSVDGTISARVGAPGALGVNNTGYTFPGDGDSGLFSHADGQIQFYTNGLERAYINGNEFTSLANFTANAAATFFGTTNLGGNTTLNGVTALGATGALAMESKKLFLRGYNDNLQFLGYRTSFAGANDIDGPVLAGFTGLLGCTNGGEHIALHWRRHNNQMKVGINGGAHNEAILRVHGAGDSLGIGQYGYVNSGGAGSGGGSNSPYTIWADGRILCNELNAVSDLRIKNVTGLSDGAADLASLMQIKVTDYTFRDTVAQGTRAQKKLIAQELEQAYPLAVSQSTNVVPDIMKKAPLENGWIALPTDLKPGERVRLLADGHSATVYDVLEVSGERFRTSFTGPNKEVFVYGREVKDFRAVDYDAVAMLNVSATQQIKKDSDSAEAALRAENAELRAQLAAQEKRQVSLESRLAALETAAKGEVRTASVPASAAGAVFTSSSK